MLVWDKKAIWVFKLDMSPCVMGLVWWPMPLWQHQNAPTLKSRPQWTNAEILLGREVLGAEGNGQSGPGLLESKENWIKQSINTLRWVIYSLDFFMISQFVLSLRLLSPNPSTVSERIGRFTSWDANCFVTLDPTNASRFRSIWTASRLATGEVIFRQFDLNDQAGGRTSTGG